MDPLCISIEFRRLWLSVGIIFISVLFLGCKKNDLEAIEKFNEIGFEIVILNKQDIEAVSFEHGTDIIFALKLTNNSNQDFEWKYDYTCQLLDLEDFLLVYQFIQDDESNSYFLPIGQPQQRPIYCLTINFAPQLIPPGENLIIKSSWNANPENEPLKKGRFYVIANFEFERNREKKEWDLKTDFKIF